MWEFLGKAGDFFKKNSDALSGIGSIVGGIGNAYSAYKQDKLAKKNYDLNLSLLNDERNRQKQSQNNLNLAWINSDFSKTENKDELV